MKQRLINILKRIPLIRFLYEKRLLITFKLLAKLPVKKKNVIFESFLGKQYSDNPRAMYELMQEEYPHLQLYWSVDRRYMHKFETLNLNIIPRLSWRWVYMMATSKYWISNSRLPLWIPKPKHTTYVQTWHGTPLKKLGVDIKNVQMPGTTTEKYHKNFTHAASKWDYLISPNRFSTEIFRRAFQYDGEILETGYPRNDYLYTHNNDDEIKRLRIKYQIPSGKKVILYAPTWRDNDYYGVGQYKFKLMLDLNKMKQELGDKYVILFRLHYLVSDHLDLNGFEGFAMNVSDAADIRELYLISDVLITDYSSVFFDYANLKRPIIFFTYDIEEYRNELRGFYLDFEKEAPGPFAMNTEEVIKYIETKNSLSFNKKLLAFHQRYCYLEEGKSTARSVNNILAQKN